MESWGEALTLLATVASDASMQELLDQPQLSKEQKGELMLKVVSDKLNKQQQNLPTKRCPVCQRDFTRRKKWERDWANVKYCSKECANRGPDLVVKRGTVR